MPGQWAAAGNGQSEANNGQSYYYSANYGNGKGTGNDPSATNNGGGTYGNEHNYVGNFNYGGGEAPYYLVGTYLCGSDGKGTNDESGSGYGNSLREGSYYGQGPVGKGHYVVSKTDPTVSGGTWNGSRR
ncbi:hypothetical protein TNIN_360651 [Trichonephila inaurata madagascariensis]|uniref:Uncharacterized protein n=1 Tax=Trichonephila inaurata madagascariensis TaxID=2747483 RepID=A0A8X6YQ45_9ARAC|nr:hypothetical protein TNIN_360651 [Trichonephila inaurata madagascariensis]